MCGIAGWIDFGGVREDLRQRVCRATGLLRHRGPDSGGVWQCESGLAVLGHRRLAIIDLSERAGQPFVDETAGLAVTFNGEIYNYRSLRRDLEERGHRFTTDSDTEVLLRAYQQYLEGVFERLEGMFAFALWDRPSRRLILARDFCGQKPLYYSVSGNSICFASEMRALRVLRPERSSLDERSLSAYCQYWCIPPPRTLVQGLSKMPAGHYLVFEKGSCRVVRHWFPIRASVRWRGDARTPEDWERLVAGQIQESVRATCVADVPVGVAFSGGSDSVAVAAGALGAMQELQTFSIDAGSCVNAEENAIRRRFWEWSRVRHESMRVSDEQLREWVDSQLRFFDEPVGDNTVIVSSLLSAAVRAYGYKVFLTGEGGDEIFIGYPWWVRLLRWSQVVHSAGRLAAAGARLIPRQHRHRAVSRLIRRAAAGPDQAYWDSQLGLPGEDRSRLLHQSCDGESDQYVEQLRTEFLEQGGLDESQWFTFVDLNLRLPEFLLLRLDRSSMQWSTEARAPLLEKRLVELALAVPQGIKVPRFEPKGLYMKCLRRLVPPELVIRRKVGYNESLRNKLSASFPRMRRSILEWNRKAGLFRAEPLDAILNRNGRESLWPLYALAEWARGTGIS